MKNIKNMSYEELIDLMDAVLKRAIYKKQKEANDKICKTKKRNDKLICQICGHKYTRDHKNEHNATRKHRVVEKELMCYYKIFKEKLETGYE